jgi:hypothetical protein
MCGTLDNDAESTSTRDTCKGGTTAPQADVVTPCSLHSHFYRRSPPQDSTARAVLAYVPQAESLGISARAAGSGALCVVEAFTFPVRGWAREVGAVDLVTGKPATPWSGAARKALDRIAFYGNNGWGSAFDRSHTSHALSELAATGDLDEDEVVAAQVARGRGLTSSSIRQLRKLIAAAG